MSDQDAWPAWATEKVVVVPADPRWAQQGAELAREVERLLGPRDGGDGDGDGDAPGLLTSAVRHVGSTAVPGLDAKPVLDLLGTVASLDVAPAAADRLRPRGWHWVPPELDGRPHERFLVQADGDSRTAHLHLYLHGDPRPDRMAAFRDLLRADPALAARYGALKRRLGVEHAGDREAYTRAKSSFVEAALAGA